LADEVSSALKRLNSLPDVPGEGADTEVDNDPGTAEENQSINPWPDAAD
jgi:hypothetical protein